MAEGMHVVSSMDVPPEPKKYTPAPEDSYLAYFSFSRKLYMAKVRKHWTLVHKEQGDESFKEAFCMDRTALVVAGALLMTVDFALLSLSESSYLETNTYNTELTYAYLATLAVATAFSLGVVIVGSFQFILMQKFGKKQPLEVAVHMEECTPSLFTPVASMLIGCYATVIATTMGVYLLHGWRGAVTFGVPGLVLFAACNYFAVLAIQRVEKWFLEKSE
jgi:hypothetical protein